MNQWWFRLYTKHFLIKFAKVTAGILCLNYLVLMVDSPFKSACLLLSFVPSFLLIISNSVGSFRSNLEFHKMSIPFNELKKGFYLDMFFKVSFSVLCTVLIFFSTISMLKGSEDVLKSMIFFTPIQFVLYVITYYIGTFYILSLNKDRKYKAFEFPQTLWKATLLLFVSSIIIAVLLGGLVLTNFSVPVILALFGASFSGGMMWFHSKAMFNQFRPIGRFRDAVSFLGKGMATACCVYLCFAFIGRNESLDHRYTNLQRASSFEFAGPFSPMVDQETFMAIEPHLDNEMKIVLYKRTDFDVESVGLDFFLDNDPYAKRLRDLITYGKPNAEFMSHLYDHFEKNAQYWEDKYNPTGLKHFAFMNYPKGKTMDVKFETAFASNKVALEKEKAERLAKRKALRDIASKKFR